jgi:hypothetical protein
MARKAQDAEQKKLTYPERYDIPRSTISEIKDQILLSWQQKQHRGAICVVMTSVQPTMAW